MTNKKNDFDEQEFSVRLIGNTVEKLEIIPEKEQFEIIGEFIQLASSIEFEINFKIEGVLGKYLNDDKINEGLFDFVGKLQQNLSVSERINLLILFLELTQGENEVIQKAIQNLRQISVDYKKKVRNYRDIVAHNPFFMTGILPSRISEFKSDEVTPKKLKECIGYMKQLLKEIEMCFRPLSIVYSRDEGLSGLRGREKKKK